MRTVKYVCDHCGHAEEYGKLAYTGIVIGLYLVIGLMACGVAFIWILASSGGMDIFNLFTSAEMTGYAAKNADDMHNITVEIVKTGCGTRSYCWATEIFDAVKYDVRYVPDPIDTETKYSARFVYEHGGDCEDLANMFVAMMNSVGMKAATVCTDVHCVAVVPNMWGDKERDGFMVIDLTAPMMQRMQQNQSVWEYSEGYND